MSHPNNLSVEYPVAGDTWLDVSKYVILTITHVSVTGVIYYMKGLSKGCVNKHRANLDAYKHELERYGLGIPSYSTNKYISTYGPV